MTKRLIICLILILAMHYSSSAQTPQWQWAQGVGGAGDDRMAGYMAVDSSGDVYVVGGLGSGSGNVVMGSSTLSSPGLFLAKYTPQGTVAWATEFPSSVVLSDIVLGEAGNIYGWGHNSSSTDWITGSDTVPPLSSFLIKYSPAGAVLWTKSIQSSNHYYLSIIKMVYRSDGHLIGLWQDEADTIDHMVLSYPCFFLGDIDTAGGVQHIVPLVNSSFYPAHIAVDDITLTSTADVYVSGQYDSTEIGLVPTSWTLPVSPNGLSGTSILAKFDRNLNFLWSRANTFRSTPHASSSGVVGTLYVSTDPSGNVFMTGGFSGDSIVFDDLSVLGLYSTRNLFLAKFDSSGTAQWLRCYYDQSGSVIAAGIGSDPLGNVYISGNYGAVSSFDSITPPASGAGMFVAKVSPQGKVRWLTTDSGTGQIYGGNIPMPMRIDGVGNVYLSGSFQLGNPILGNDTLYLHTPTSGYPYNEDIFTARLGYCQPATPAVSASGPLIWCGADSVRLTAPASHSYLWSTGDTSRSIVVSSTGSYTVYAADSLGCYARSATLSVRAYTNPSLSASVAQNVKCYGDSSGQISLAATGGASPYTYMATPPVSDYHAVHAARYYITATDSDGCHAYDSVTVTQPASPLSITIDTISGTAAGYGEAIAIAAGATPPYSYLWSDQQNTDTAHHLTAGWYSLIVTDSNGCRATDSVYIQRYDGIATLSDGGISSYPNPSSGRVYIQSSSDGAIEVYDISGQLMMQGTVSAGLSSIDCGDWPASVYIIQIRKQGLLLFEQKVSISH